MFLSIEITIMDLLVESGAEDILGYNGTGRHI